MMNPKLVALLRQAVQDEENEKIVLIDDIVRAKKFLWVQGFKEHDEFLTATGRVKLFDELYDLDICSLRVAMDLYTKQINESIKPLQTA